MGVKRELMKKEKEIKAKYDEEKKKYKEAKDKNKTHKESIEVVDSEDSLNEVLFIGNIAYKLIMSRLKKFQAEKYHQCERFRSNPPQHKICIAKAKTDIEREKLKIRKKLEAAKQKDADERAKIKEK